MRTKNGLFLFMKKLKVFSFILFLLFGLHLSIAQINFTGVVKNAVTNTPLQNVEVYSKLSAKAVYTNAEGKFTISLKAEKQLLVFIALGYKIKEVEVNPLLKKAFAISLEPLAEQLSEIVIDQQKQRIFGIKNLKSVEGTAIYEGKKTEVVLVDQLISNKASGNPRQAYAQVAGLNIYETEDAGLQLNIGGRGLDPNRSANFNTRQNGYDISADVLGYPESYYTPSLEALDEIQVVRGAASLQYGTQFGGLVNFKLKDPNPTKKLELITRQGIGSFGLFNSFNSLSGTINKISYYTFFQYKKGDGFRPNSDFDSKNLYAQVGYQFTDKTKLTFESTFLNYVAQQAGGLSDNQFAENPDFSNRPRNFFSVDWNLLNLKLEHKFSAKTNASINLFTLNASRKALGFRDRRTTIEDNSINPRELIVDDFNNWGAEARLLTRYKLFGKSSVFLIGSKYYQSLNKSQQGIGPSGIGEDFRFVNEDFSESSLPESKFDFPNLNVSLFGENIYKLSPTFSITPGFRLEYINTESDGSFVRKPVDGNGNVLERITTPENRTNDRTFLLLGAGFSYKPSNQLEAFANFSQNYRSVTFNDIRIVSPGFRVDPNISDETGYTADLGIRGSISDFFRYDVSVFSLFYDDRIGQSIVRENDTEAPTVRSNQGTARIIGLESLLTVNFSNWLFPEKKQFHWQHFLNTAYTTSEYTESDRNEIVGNMVEFIPEWNIKTGLELGYKNIKSSLQYTYISSQFTDATNAEAIPSSSIRGEIPAYSVMDFSLEYNHKKWTLETGINNILNERYFTRRATGYPGPGIIPSAPVNYYVVLQFKI